MWMTDREIYMSYKSAGETPTQIRILSELNACSQKEIRNVIRRYSKMKKERNKNYQAFMKKNKEEQERSNDQANFAYKEKSSWARIEGEPSSILEPYDHDIRQSYNVVSSKDITESQGIHHEYLPEFSINFSITQDERSDTMADTSYRHPEPKSGISLRSDINNENINEVGLSANKNPSSSAMHILIESVKNVLNDQNIDEICIKIKPTKEVNHNNIEQKVENASNNHKEVISTERDIIDEGSSDEKLRWRKRTVIQNDWENDWNNYIDSMRDHLSQAKECEKQLKKLERQHGSHRRKVKIKEEKND